jgi:cobalt/nickel transport system ATP-binding protein
VIGLLNRLDHTRIVASHDLDLILDVCQRVILLHQGTVAADGDCKIVFGQPALLAECGLEPPLSLQGCPVCRGATGRSS